MREGACRFAGRDASARVSLRGRADAAPARESSFHGWARRSSARGRGRCELAQEPPRCSALRPIAHSRAPRRLDNRSDSTRHGRPGEHCKLLHGKLRIATLPLVIKGQKAGAEERDEHVEVRPQVLRQPQRIALWSVSAARSTRRIPSAQPSAAPPASRAPSSTPCDASSSSPSTSGLPPRAGKKNARNDYRCGHSPRPSQTGGPYALFDQSAPLVLLEKRIYYFVFHANKD